MELANVFVHFKRLQDPLMKLCTYVPPTKGVRSALLPCTARWKSCDSHEPGIHAALTPSCSSVGAHRTFQTGCWRLW